MDTKPTQECPQCGAALLPNAPAGLCPACLMALNLKPETVLTGDGSENHPAQPPLPPEEIAPHFPQFEILECLGRGGMGVVYKARQKSLNRPVALKLLAPERAEDPLFAARFEKEARALAALNHPNIVTIYDHGQAGGSCYLLMEYVDGVSLRQLLSKGRVSAREALAIVPQICDALQFAHDQGIVHRDIKPENILLDRRGQVKVADFGLARIVGQASDPSRAPDQSAPPGGSADKMEPGVTPTRQDLTDASKVMGTPQYMSPEQVHAPGEVDHRADIYALGVVFYQMLTGELPDNDLQPPSKKVHIDVRLDEVVLRALEQKPELRYQQASVLKTQVETIAAADGESALSSSPPAGRSKLVRILETMFSLTFTSPLAMRLVNLSALGFLGSLAFLGFVPVPGMKTCFAFAGFAGFFGLIGVAFLVEFTKRNKSQAARTPGSVARPNEQQQPYNQWEITTIAAGAVVFIILLLVALEEWSRPFRLPLLGMCILGLGICATSIAGLWPFPSPLFPEPNFSSRNLRRHKGAADNSRRTRTLLAGAAILAVVLIALLVRMNLRPPEPLAQQTTVFGPVMERFIALGNTSNSFYSFEHGYVPGPTDFDPTDEGNKHRLWAWLRANKVDVFARASNGRPVVVRSEMVTMSLDEDDFDGMSPTDLERNRGWISAVKAQVRPQESSTGSRGRLQGSKDTIAFQTRYEQTGLLQVVHVSGNPPGLNIRYKLVQSTVSSRLQPGTAAVASLKGEETSVSISNLLVQDALLHLARAQGLNCVLDPRIADDAEFDLRHTYVNVNWTNTTPAEAFAALLANYQLQIITNAQTGVAQITAAEEDNEDAARVLEEQIEGVGANGASATQPALTVIRVSDKQVEVEVASDGDKKLSLYVGANKWGSSPLAGGKTSLSKIEASDQIELENGSLGHGIIWTRIVDGVSSKQFLAITEDGQLPYGEVQIRNAEAIGKTRHDLTVGDVERPDGSRVPISLRLE